MDLTLVVGLGNPGRRYAETRHNLGFRCLEILAAAHAMRFDRRLAESQVASGTIGGLPVVLAKPQTYMNLSGRAVRALLGELRLSAQDLIVVYDDLDLSLGRLRVRARGSAGGHRGIKSIIDALGTTEFRRVRVGIGRPQRGDAIEYVLEPFPRDEEPIARVACEAAAKAVEYLLLEGLEAAMSRVNKQVNPKA